MECLDERPMFGPDMVPFFRFIADYYHYPLGMAIAEALPSGLKVMSRRTARLTPEGKRVLTEGSADPDELGWLARLDRSGGLALARLAKEKGDGASVVRRLITAGWATTEDLMQTDRVRPRTERWLVPLSETAAVSSTRPPDRRN
jgi:primosomal protein N' (replication factor Y)